jgi:hypothetical protein
LLIGVTIVLILQVHEARKLTKRDTFVLMSADDERYHKAAQVQSAFHLWVKTPDNLRFLEQWVSYFTLSLTYRLHLIAHHSLYYYVRGVIKRRWCSDMRVISDIPNTQGRMIPHLVCARSYLMCTTTCRITFRMTYAVVYHFCNRSAKLSRFS